ncbi:hypothetical protein ABC795_01345 [Blastococcus sp. HT6-30]|uniref:hypothetical protein n=1 Tax=Blastococcus sp. HT6-30 TaxID=3144843 RepID=UPI003219742C
MWWLSVLAGLVAWLVLASVLAVLIGRGIRLADVSAARSRHRTNAMPEAAAARAAGPDQAPPLHRAGRRLRRRPVPLPRLGIALMAVAVLLETTGYVLELAGDAGAVAQLFSMDDRYSLPRLYIAGLFAVAAVVAWAGAGRIPGRRTWWLAVGLVAAGMATVKAGSNVHKRVVVGLTDAVGVGVATAMSAVAAGVVVGGLWWLSRHERRDRRRILTVLACYAVASVGLSAVSYVTAGAFGVASRWTYAATFVEESGEALAGVAFLVAVLIGVAPRLALPAEWALRRAADAHALDLPEQLPGTVPEPGAARS